MAHILPFQVMARLRSLAVPNTTNENSHRLAPTAENGSYQPTPIDVVVTRILLSRGLNLPPDIVDVIFDHAEYWAHSTNYLNFRARDGSPLQILGNSEVENKLLIRSYPLGLTGLGEDRSDDDRGRYDTSQGTPLPLKKEHKPDYFRKLLDYPTPKLLSPARKVVYTIRANDQGWGGPLETKGTYAGSWTWFEAGLERFEANQNEDKPAVPSHETAPKSLASAFPPSSLRTLQPEIQGARSSHDDADTPASRYIFPLAPQDNLTIQRNLAATKDFQDHVITWSCKDDTEPHTSDADELERQGRGRATGEGSFVRDLRLGDVVSVWGKARFPGWSNNVESVKIDVYWAV